MPSMSSSRNQTAAASLSALLAGNRRFAAGTPTSGVVTTERRTELLEGQYPRAVLIGCVDARVAPELILDQSVGDLLTIRTAGQSLAGVALGSIEFGVRVLGVPLVVVLGHTGCGAVLAAMDENQPDGHLGHLVGEVAQRLSDLVGDDPVRATGANLQATVDALRGLGTLTYEDAPAYVVGALYDMGTGEVTITDDAGLDLA